MLITGAKGQLGHDICRLLRKRQIEHLGVDSTDFDVTDTIATRAFIQAYHPEMVVHCAAYTDVEHAEGDAEKCMRINRDGTANIAEACAPLGATMIYISTDYVFSGLSGDTPHEINDPVSPINQYGKSKAAGEDAVKSILHRYFIVRTSWMFGINGRNFVSTMLNIGRERGIVDVVCDQVGSPTYSFDLADWIIDLALTRYYGIYHATNEGYCSFADLAEKAFELASIKTKVNHIYTGDYATSVKRPLNSRLSKKSSDRIGLKRFPTWQNALERYVKEYMLK
jgi:dTDP-4-dehydrorhamnose reductase